ncbi:hypothetical protein DL766_009767 [Monosporascus sp. MC13-8B]|nr:hypothetical protein DL763_007417 [Monosporascus cannonballus]RYP14086.1 hypothetical protein DL766_009767 [Monosporascus sp. MC13-8B]
MSPSERPTDPESEPLVPQGDAPAGDAAEARRNINAFRALWQKLSDVWEVLQELWRLAPEGFLVSRPIDRTGVRRAFGDLRAYLDDPRLAAAPGVDAAYIGLARERLDVVARKTEGLLDILDARTGSLTLPRTSNAVFGLFRRQVPDGLDVALRAEERILREQLESLDGGGGGGSSFLSPPSSPTSAFVEIPSPDRGKDKGKGKGAVTGGDTYEAETEADADRRVAQMRVAVEAMLKNVRKEVDDESKETVKVINQLTKQRYTRVGFVISVTAALSSGTFALICRHWAKKAQGAAGEASAAAAAIEHLLQG